MCNNFETRCSNAHQQHWLCKQYETITAAGEDGEEVSYMLPYINTGQRHWLMVLVAFCPLALTILYYFQSLSRLKAATNTPLTFTTDFPALLKLPQWMDCVFLFIHLRLPLLVVIVFKTDIASTVSVTV